MDRNLFTSAALGKLEKIKTDSGDDWAFIPDPLPKTWDIPLDLWPLLSQAKEEVARLDGIGRHMSNNTDLLLTPLQKREALKSSSLEGAYATAEELLMFEKEPREATSEHDKVNAWKEVFNYGSSLRRGLELLEEIPFCVRLIKSLHKELLSGVRGANKNPGNFRTNQFHIGSDRRFIPPPHFHADSCLYELEKYMNEEISIDPLILSFMVHYQFETIHPFSDGNGRVGRLMLSLMIYKFCNLSNPWLYLSEFFDKYKDEYVDNLFNVSAKGDWINYIKFCLRATVIQAKDSIVRFDNLVELREKYIQLIGSSGGGARLNQIVEKLFNSPVITIPDIEKICSTTYPTAKKDVELLCSLGILSEGARSHRPKYFWAKEIFDVAYSGV